MHTAKDIAEIISKEITRLGNGEVRTGVIDGLSKCTNVLINLARLEMDYATSGKRPDILFSNGQPSLPPQSPPAKAHNNTSAKAATLESIRKQIEDKTKQMNGLVKGTPMKKILQDQVDNLQAKYEIEEQK